MIKVTIETENFKDTLVLDQVCLLGKNEDGIRIYKNASIEFQCFAAFELQHGAMRNVREADKREVTVNGSTT